MTDTAPAVALLFDDIELGGQLRDALHERGARIVHEGGMSSLSRELLLKVGAEVVVVNLDDSADDALDHLYDVINGDLPRIVFNDAQASRALSGWDRARWARHLAVKVLAAGDIDPPRPENARDIEVPSDPGTGTAFDEVAAEPVGDAATMVSPVDEESSGETGMHASSTELPPSMPELAAPDDIDEQHEQMAAAESENLAAELEALLAAGDLPADDADETGPGLRYINDEDLPPLHDGNFGVPAATHDTDSLDERDGIAAFVDDDADELSSNVTPPVFQLDHLQLSPLTDDSVATIPATAVEPALAHGATTTTHAPMGWALLDDEALLAESTKLSAGESGAAFGIEKLSAADFLAPDVEQVAAGVEPVMNLQLVSIEEAIAPQAFQPVREMLLDDVSGALSRVVLLGAAVSGIDSVCSFLAALPIDMNLAFLHTQHLNGQPIEPLLEKLTAHSVLPVRVAEQGSRARVGEVLLVPVGQQLRLFRDGSIELQASGSNTMQDPSIDASFSMAASAFGRDALAIVFAGRGTDAVAGSQAIHDRGGQVWVESSSGEHFADMVSGIFAERLVSFSGTPHELAAHLIEVFP